MAADLEGRMHDAVLKSDPAVEIAVKALASAFGLPSAMTVALVRSTAGGEQTQSDPTATLSVFARGSVRQSANGYLPTSRAERERVLQSFKPGDRDAVLAFEQSAQMRRAGSSTRTRQIRAWSASSMHVALPAARPSRSVLHALVDARLTGPLEHWLLLYALRMPNRWGTVSRFMEACGHSHWAAREAALRLMGARRPFRDIAKEQAMRESSCRTQVIAAERRLLDWLSRASRCVVQAMGIDID